LRVPDQNLRHVRASAKTPDQNLDRLRESAQVGKELRLVQTRRSKPFEIDESLIRIRRLGDRREQVFKNLREQLAFRRISGHGLKLRISARDIPQAERLQQCGYRLSIELRGEQQILDVQCRHSL
jgi:hypothetical protein